MDDTGSTLADRRRLASGLGFDVDRERVRSFDESAFLPDEVGQAFDRGFQAGGEYMFRLLSPHLPESVTGPRSGPAVQPAFADMPTPSNREYMRMLETTGAQPARYLEERRETVIGPHGDDVRRAWTHAYDDGFDAAIRLLYPYLPERIRNPKEETE